MKIFLGFLLLCVTCLSAFALENSYLIKYCEKCLEDSVVSGYYEHPQRCDGFVQCQYVNKTLTAFEQFCNEDTCYNKETQNCDYCSETTCQKKCDYPTKFKDVFSCNKYFECDNSGFNYEAKICPPQERFDQKTSRCVSDYRCVGPVLIKPCSETFKPSKSLGKFWQKDATGWIEKECGPGTGFDVKSCTCAKMIPVNDAKTCLILDMPLKNSCVELSHNYWVNNLNVTFSNGAAQFTTGSGLVIPALINNDLGENVEISMNFYIKSSPKDSYTIVTNGNCDRKPSLSIGVENANTFPTVFGFMKLEGNVSPVQMRTRVVLNEWYNIRFGKSSDKVRMYLNNNLQKEIKIEGAIEVVDSALSIGKPCAQNVFVGSVNMFKLTKCPSW
ncbi:uncharacterized protein LOC115219132 [Octopus sinensis]|uniref:Uncharacterized protein LOC115219132 n=1 Tax=Octopus sinensis TaxID=2607531 RepID=A0A6P7T443_9MOLL|nr:uncharacterized protein LOC115219132 [Octopus sinensis]